MDLDDFHDSIVNTDLTKHYQRIAPERVKVINWGHLR